MVDIAREAGMPVRLYDAATNALVVELADTDLPEGMLDLGAKLIVSQSQYRGARQQTVQVLGVEEQPIEIEGQLETYPGRPAAEAAATLDTALRRGRRLVLEWGEHRREGLLVECRPVYQDADLVRYRLAFRPDTGPGRRPDNGRAKALQGQEPDSLRIEVVEQDTAEVRSVLDGLRPTNAVRLELLTMLYALENRVSDLASLARSVLAVGEVGVEVARRIAQHGAAAIQAARDLAERGRTLVVGDAGSLDAIRQQVVVTDAVSAARTVEGRLLAMIRATLTRIEGPAGTREHVCRDGDTYASVSLAYYGDAEEWRRIWDANPTAPVRLAPGTRLRIPARTDG